MYNQRYNLRMYNEDSAVWSEGADLVPVTATIDSTPVRLRLYESVLTGAGSVDSISSSIIVGVGSALNVIDAESTALGLRGTSALVDAVGQSSSDVLRIRKDTADSTVNSQVNGEPLRQSGGLSSEEITVQSTGYYVMILYSESTVTGEVTSSVDGMTQVIGISQPLIEIDSNSLANTVMIGSGNSDIETEIDTYSVIQYISDSTVLLQSNSSGDSYLFRWHDQTESQDTWTDRDESKTSWTSQNRKVRDWSEIING